MHWVPWILPIVSCEQRIRVQHRKFLLYRVSMVDAVQKDHRCDNSWEVHSIPLADFHLLKQRLGNSRGKLALINYWEVLHRPFNCVPSIASHISTHKDISKSKRLFLQVKQLEHIPRVYLWHHLAHCFLLQREFAKLRHFRFGIYPIGLDFISNVERYLHFQVLWHHQRAIKYHRGICQWCKSIHDSRGLLDLVSRYRQSYAWLPSQPHFALGVRNGLLWRLRWLRRTRYRRRLSAWKMGCVFNRHDLHSGHSLKLTYCNPRWLLRQSPIRPQVLRYALEDRSDPELEPKSPLQKQRPERNEIHPSHQVYDPRGQRRWRLGGQNQEDGQEAQQHKQLDVLQRAIGWATGPDGLDQDPYQSANDYKIVTIRAERTCGWQRNLRNEKRG